MTHEKLFKILYHTFDKNYYLKKLMNNHLNEKVKLIVKI